MIGNGIGGNQAQWRPVAETLAERFTVVTFSLAGAPGADPDLFSPLRHSSLVAFAEDLSALVLDLSLRGCAYLGHSMSAMAGALAQAGDPGLFCRMVLLNGSARYVDDTGYVGGFGEADVDQILLDIATDYDLWAGGFGQHVVGNPDQPQAAQEFVTSLRALGPRVAAVALRAALRGDYREYMALVQCPTLVLQSSDDPAVPLAASQWLAHAIPGAQFRQLAATGHHPHLVEPDEISTAVLAFLELRP